MAVPTNPCSEVQTVTVESGGSYTITFPAAPPVGQITQMYNNGQQVKVMSTPAGWARLDIETGDLSEWGPAELEEKMKEIEALFEVCEHLNASELPYVSMNEKAQEYNRFEEELIRQLDERPPLTIDTCPGSVYDTMMKPIEQALKDLAEIPLQ